MVTQMMTVALNILRAGVDKGREMCYSQDVKSSSLYLGGSPFFSLKC